MEDATVRTLGNTMKYLQYDTHVKLLLLCEAQATSVATDVV